MTTLKTSPPAGADQFAKRFDELVKTAVKPSRGQRLVVFIDELDRCAPGDVVSTLIDLKTFLDHPSCAFIVAADREVLETALRQVPQAKPVRQAEPYYATPGAFLDKIFQYQIALPPLRARALTRFAQDVLAPQGGLWEDLRSKSVDEYERVVFALVPIHVRSPRRVKVLLNNFAATVRVAEGRSIPWTERASELAVLTVLQTEFPSVAAELTKVPRLLSYLRGVEEPRDKEATEAFERFAPRSSDSAPAPTQADDTTTVDTPAGTLLAESASTSLDAADDLLRRQLANYLSKIAAAGIEDPRPDLMYLQGAAGSSDLGDSRLGDVIDFAADTAPDDVVEQFASASSHTLAMAVPLLVAEGETASRPGQALAYESACRLIERIDPTEQAAVARTVSPAVLAAAGAQRLSRDSAPGALIVAACVGADDIVATILDELRNEDLPPALLTRVAPVADRLDAGNLRTFADILIDRYELEPEPLVALLRAVSIQRATQLWPGIAARVLAIIDRLETPPAAAPTPARQVAASPSGPTGLGLQRLDQLIDAAKSRPDGEPLVGAIYETVQLADNAAQKAWALKHVDAHLGTLESPQLRARHTILGILNYEPDDWDVWLTLCPEAPPPESDLDDIAGDALVSRIIPSVTVGSTQVQLDTVARAATSICRLAPVPIDRAREALQKEIEGIGWEGIDDDGPTSMLPWQRRSALVDVARAIAGDAPNSVVFEPIADDLASAPATITLNPNVATQLITIAKQLPMQALQRFSDALDETTYEGEEAATVQLRLAARQILGGPALSADDLLVVPQDERTTELTSAWLELAPPLDEVADVLGSALFAPDSLRTYSGRLTAEQRTHLWIRAAELNSGAAILNSVGAGGLTAAAVEMISERVRDAVNATARAEHVATLLKAKVNGGDSTNAVRKTASELAAYLLGTGTSADARTAADVVIWAGGAGHGYVQQLRDAFTAAIKNNDRALPKNHIRELDKLKLVIVQKKGLIAKILGR